MKYFGMIILLGVLLIGFDAGAEDGKGVFDSLRCGNCHKADTGKANPSLKDIARAYKGNEKQLPSYLKGEVGSIVSPEKGDRMKSYIEKTKALKDGDRKALADFILSHRD